MGNKVKHFRENLNLTQHELSKKSGVSRNTISLLETQDNVNVTYDIMNKLSKALEQKVSTIFFDE